MIKIYVVTALAFISLLPLQARAADEFGNRFYGHAPAALGDYTAKPAQDIAQDEELAKELQNIMPAAGDEHADKAEDSADKEKAEKAKKTEE